ncbi:MAG: FKBP-type peptidyl-prolyl cis-trans isomerase [Butyricicoccus sp.]
MLSRAARAKATTKLGSGTFIPGFEDQLIGLKAGEEKDVVVTFPEEYHAKELAARKYCALYTRLGRP